MARVFLRLGFTLCFVSSISALYITTPPPSISYPIYNSTTTTSNQLKGLKTAPTPSPMTTTAAKPSTITPCPTVTVTKGEFCPAITGCRTPDCILLSTINVPCRCAGLETRTVCATGCQEGCGVAFSGVTSAACTEVGRGGYRYGYGFV